MCIDALESTTNSSSSGDYEAGAGIVLASIGEENVDLSIFDLVDRYSSPSPTLLCGRIFLGASLLTLGSALFE